MSYDFDNAVVERKSNADIGRECTAALNGLDVLAREMERKWGHARLPHLVPDELTQRFYSQHKKVSMALRDGRWADAIAEMKKMTAAWRYLDQEAERLGAEPISPVVFETSLSDGTVIAIVRDEDEAAAVDPADRNVRVFMITEIARLIEAMPTLCDIKLEFPGAKVIEPRNRPSDQFWAEGDPIPF